MTLLLLLFTSLPSRAQLWDKLAGSDYRVLPETAGELRFEADVLAFFRDNEYSSKLTKGYSLPGAIAQPKLTFVPIHQIRLELGLHALLFNGANKYPCYVYHDIGRWKGHQYQSGAHMLPWLRVQAQFKHLTIVMGDIFGGENHRLVQPLWNSETNLSQDPEMGAQLLWDLPHLHADTWINWQSYIFEEDTHQEAFTVGTTWHILYGDSHNDLRFSTPLQLLFNHRGGEQDITDMGVQTICNASLGVRADYRTWHNTITHLGGEVNALGAYQQAGSLWPFKSGFALHAGADMRLWQSLHLRAGWFCAPRHFASLYGSPFFNTVSLRSEEHFQGIHTALLHADYAHTFAARYTVGASIEAANSWLGTSQASAKSSEFNFSFGIFVRAYPSVLIKKWR